MVMTLIHTAFLLVGATLIPLGHGFSMHRATAYQTHKSLLYVASQDAMCDATQEQQDLDRNVAVQNLLTLARELGPVGADRTEEEQMQILKDARALAERFPTPSPARFPLTGIHKTVYSAAPGGSSGKLIGPINGKVQQEFVDDVTFVNSVELGPLRIALRAERTVMNDTKIKVIFRETSVSLFGNVVTTKPIENQGGVWSCLFVGEITDSLSGQRKLVRVLETPSLFVIEQDLE